MTRVGIAVINVHITVGAGPPCLAGTAIETYVVLIHVHVRIHVVYTNMYMSLKVVSTNYRFLFLLSS